MNMKRILTAIILLAMATSALALDRIRWYERDGWVIEKYKTSSEMDKSRDIWGPRLVSVRTLMRSGVELRHIRYERQAGHATASEMTQGQKDARDLPEKYREWDAKTQLWKEKSKAEKDAADEMEAAQQLAELIEQSDIDARHFEKAMFRTMSTRMETCLKAIRTMAANNAQIQGWLTGAGITAADVAPTTPSEYRAEVITRYTNYVQKAQSPAEIRK